MYKLQRITNTLVITDVNGYFICRFHGGDYHSIDDMELAASEFVDKLNGVSQPTTPIEEVGKKTIELPIYNIVVKLDGKSGSIRSLLKEFEDDANLYTAAIDALESLILAHACAGIDITSPAYLEGIETAVDAIVNNLD